jgi:flavin reductase (DIM6/NTAB) family NADH-FMN oxidoreductase RutF
VSSLLVAEGKEPALIGLLDPASDLWDRFEGTGRAVVNVLDWRHQTLAEVFAGRYPSPGGKFSTGDWSPGTHGPVLAGVPAQVAVELRGVTEVGWSILAECAIVAVTFADSDSDSGSSPGSGVDSSPAPGSGADSGAGSGVSRGEENKPADPLAYLRGRYRRLAPVSGSTPRSEGASVTS